MILGVLSAVIAFVLQGALLTNLRPSRLVGDEAEYTCAPSDHPHAALWVRVPLFAAMIRGALRLGPSGPRRLTSALAAVTVGVTVWQVAVAAGPLAGLVGAMLLLFSFERAILSLHLWPDTAMGLCWLVAVICITVPFTHGATGLALIGALALGLLIEGAALWGLGFVAPWLVPGPVPALALVITTLAPLLYILWNGLGTGVWRLDTTIGFNTAAMRADAATQADTVAGVMRQTVQSRREPAPTERPPWPSLRSLLGRLTARLRLLLGPETFATEVLIGAERAGYQPNHWLGRSRLAATLLRHGFTTLFAANLIVLPLAPPLSVLALVGAIGIYALLVTRSRYRMALLPLVVVQTVTGWTQVITDGPSPAVALGVAVLVGFGVLLIRAPRLSEV